MRKKFTLRHILGLSFFLLFFGIGFGFLEKRAFGVAECTPIYGGGEVCPSVDLDVDKQVAHPSSGEFRENLFETDPKFSSGNIVTFKLVVTNTGETRLTDVKVTDTLPNVLDFYSGAGKLDGKQITIEVGDLEAGESETFIIRAVVVGERISAPTVCNIPNWVKAEGEENGNKLTRTDLAKFCVEKEVLGEVVPPAKELPAAGAGGVLLLTTTLTATGLLLRRYA